MITTTSPAAPGWLSRIGNKLAARPAPVQAATSRIDAAASTPPSPVLAILGAALRTPHGASADELGARLAANKVDADLDPQLVDDQGLPVMTARSAQAIDEAVREEIADWLADSATPDLAFSDEQWRALVLGTAVMRDLAQQAAALALREEQGPAMLRLALLLPDGWQDAQRQAVSNWWLQVLAQSGWSAARLGVAEPDAASPAALVARLAHDGVASTQAVATILLACASHIGQDTVDRWSADGTLFTPGHPRGRIPGEGAAGLLLAGVRLAHSLDEAGCAQLLVQVDDGDHASDSARRLSPQRLNTLAERLLQDASIAPADIALIVADTGTDTRQALELMEFGAASAPHLDNASDIVRLGPACGACEAVPFVAALVLGAHAALEMNAPLLCVSNAMPGCRALALVRPGLPPRDTA